MRLECPNCDATYEVPDSVIPPEGREVQCSNCGSAWFFDPNAPEPEIAAPEPAPAAPPAPETAYSPEPDTMFEEEPEEEIQVAAPEPEEAAIPRRRQLESAVVDVLRQEAEYEARARAEEAGLEYQEDLPLAEPERPAAPALEQEDVSRPPSSRRDLLPDIDEINSTLRATSERKTAQKATPQEIKEVQRQRRGFRTGFGLSLFLLGLFAAAYSYSGALSEQIPAIAGALESYVEWVNGGRAWLEDAMTGVVARMGA
ncbi:MAG: zinc-ribbon domain-containing protein [Pseudomonadota bacterium]